jgi:hypothetical protein
MSATRHTALVPRTTPYSRPQTARRTSPLPTMDYGTLRNKVEEALLNRDEAEAPIHFNIMDADNLDIITLARENLETLQRFQNSRIFMSYYAMGYARQVYIENQTHKPTDAEIIDHYGLSIRENRLARRTYEMFKHWPSALRRIGNLTITQWEQATERDFRRLLEELIQYYPAEPNDYLADFVPSPPREQSWSDLYTSDPDSGYDEPRVSPPPRQQTPYYEREREQVVPIQWRIDLEPTPIKEEDPEPQTPLTLIQPESWIRTVLPDDHPDTWFYRPPGQDPADPEAPVAYVAPYRFPGYFDPVTEALDFSEL